MNAKMKNSKLLVKQARDAEQEAIPKIFPFYWNPPFLLPFDYNFTVVQNAVEFLVYDTEKRCGKWKKLSLKGDSLEIEEEEKMKRKIHFQGVQKHQKMINH